MRKAGIGNSEVRCSGGVGSDILNVALSLFRLEYIENMYVMHFTEAFLSNCSKIAEMWCICMVYYTKSRPCTDLRQEPLVHGQPTRELRAARSDAAGVEQA